MKPKLKDKIIKMVEEKPCFYNELKEFIPVNSNYLCLLLNRLVLMRRIGKYRIPNTPKEIIYFANSKKARLDAYNRILEEFPKAFHPQRKWVESRALLKAIALERRARRFSKKSK